MNAFFYPLKRGFYFAEIQGGKVTAYIVKHAPFLTAPPWAPPNASPLTLPATVLQLLQKATLALTQVQAYWGEVSMRTRWPGGPPFA